ncbi:MAG: lipocalin family protein [Alphaproteobacteria bacterium]|nr:lipocalin family protein [Alphaproteobacteria bacterium]MBU1515593.1 lipocalin family protein [Alphaproteobacteria bacterium]MBU2096928.1 lipocalin family protein [Alphaproteobacteria bacterium]MBU2149583.1 lipocalin family protein [Alphaproteobacteria bacterium]MBU2305681.1 lipocalin family protein [Alphaproteobacteria bacterium]
MKSRTLVLAAGAVLLLAGCASMAGSKDVRAPEPAKRIDAAAHFTGRWYEIGRTPMKLTDGCVAGYTDYLRDGDKLIQRDGCRSGTPAGKEKVVAGPLKILNPGQNNKVQVNYRLFGFVPVGRTYWFLDHGDGWFIMSTPDLKLVNLYTRDPRPSPGVVADLTARTKAFGYTGELEFPEVFPPGQR